MPTTRSTDTIVAWTPLGDEQERALRRTLGSEFRVIYCRTEHELWDALESPAVGSLVLELGLSTRPDSHSLMSTVRQRFSSLSIIGYGWLTPTLAEDILACSRFGLDGLGLRGYCEFDRVVRRVLAQCKGAEDVVVLDLGEWLTPTMLKLVRLLADRASDAPSLSQLARALGRSTRTLQRIVAREGGCAPRDLLLGFRVLIAIHLLAKERRSLLETLRRTGFASRRTLMAAMRRFGLVWPEPHQGELTYHRARERVLCTISAPFRRRMCDGSLQAFAPHGVPGDYVESDHADTSVVIRHRERRRA